MDLLFCFPQLLSFSDRNDSIRSSPIVSDLLSFVAVVAEVIVYYRSSLTFIVFNR